VFGTYHGASTIMSRAFDWKRSRTDVGCGSRAPELDTISLDRFEDGSLLVVSAIRPQAPSRSQQHDSRITTFISYKPHQKSQLSG
jgi:hypothetical protein